MLDNVFKPFQEKVNKKLDRLMALFANTNIDDFHEMFPSVTRETCTEDFVGIYNELKAMFE